MTDKTKKNPLQGRFTLIATAIKNVLKAQATYDNAMAYLKELAAEGKSPSELAYGRKKAEEKLAAAKESGVETLRSYLADLKTQVMAHHVLDLTDPKLVTAMNMINAAGPNLDSATVGQLNSTFSGNQAALQALRTLYVANGVNISEINGLVYNVDRTFDELETQVVRSVHGHGGNNMNDLARSLGVVAKGEGITDWNEEPDGSDLTSTILERTGLRNREENGLRKVMNDN